MGQFGISQSVTRVEDDRLLRGKGSFIDDLAPDVLLIGFFLRSVMAHANIVVGDVTEAKHSPGVVDVILAADLIKDNIGEIAPGAALKVIDGTKYVEHRNQNLAYDRVRYMGEPIAFVVAETLQQARDAVELIEIDYEDLPSVTDCREACAENAPEIWPNTPYNVGFHWENGDRAAVDLAFSSAARTVALDVVNNRVVLNALEPRGALGEYNSAEEKFTLTTTTQMPHGIKNNLASEVFKIPSEKIRVLVGDVGGSFGGKNAPYPEYVLTLYAARRLGRPVKWIGERSDAFASDYHGRDNRSAGELALDGENRILGLRIKSEANLGAYLASGGAVSPTSGTVMLSNTYQIPAIHVHVRGVYTNTVPTAPYRGAGRPEAIYLVERLMDSGADAAGMDRSEFRRLNLIPPSAFPYASPMGMTYDFAELDNVMAQALGIVDWPGIGKRRRQAEVKGRIYGIGVSNYIERCGGGDGLSERAEVVADADGRIIVYSGSQSNGQGHETAFSQIVNEQLNVPFERIAVVQGDTDRVKSGIGTGGSWSIPMGGGAISQASDNLAEKLKQLAADDMEAAAADVEFKDGAYHVSGTDIRRDFMEILDKSNSVTTGVANFEPEHYTFPYGCHICEVLLDPETGQVELIGYTAVHDFGRALNPMLLAGQVHGGVVQGIGQALMEETAYDDQGQMLSGSYMDYRLPRADDLPSLLFENAATPTNRNPMGVKGCGEAGATGAPPAVLNAILDALKYSFGSNVVLDMPATPYHIWQAIQVAAGATNR